MPNKLRTDLEQYIGPMPQPGFRLNLGPLQIGPFGQTDPQYEAERDVWMARAKSLLPTLAERSLTPMSAGQFSDVTGRPAEFGAGPEQYRETMVDVPVSGPNYPMVAGRRMHPFQPEALSSVPREILRSGYGQPSTLPEGGIPLYRTDIPPLDPQVLRTPTMPTRTSIESRVSPDLPASPLQRQLVESEITRAAKWPPGMGSLRTREHDVMALVNAGVDPVAAARTVYGKEPLAGGVREAGLQAGTALKGAQAGDIPSQAETREGELARKTAQDQHMRAYHDAMISHLSTADEQGRARLMEKIWMDSKVLEWAWAQNKAGLLSDDQVKALQEKQLSDLGMESTEREPATLMERFQGFLGAEPPKEYKVAPGPARPNLTPPKEVYPQGGLPGRTPVSPTAEEVRQAIEKAHGSVKQKEPTLAEALAEARKNPQAFKGRSFYDVPSGRTYTFDGKDFK